MDQTTNRLLFSELDALEQVLSQFGSSARIRTLATVPFQKYQFPIYGLTLGSTDPHAPVFGIFAGVHGLEKIGTSVVVSYLQTLSALSKWDVTFKTLLRKVRIIAIPLINPVGMYRKTRSNGNGVDIMRNAPVEAESSHFSLHSGHRLSPKLPWYRGPLGAEMEAETQTLLEFVKLESFFSKTAILLDVHSGFGLRDQLWLPFAYSQKPFPKAVHVMALKTLLDETYPRHIYKFEPQSKNYLTHGDVWDHLFLQHQSFAPQNTWIPLTLEMGSWMWIKKNPMQLFNALGTFNPVKPHRMQRTLRRHLILFDFLTRAVISPEPWMNLSEERFQSLTQRTQAQWYTS